MSQVGIGQIQLVVSQTFYITFFIIQKAVEFLCEDIDLIVWYSILFLISFYYNLVICFKLIRIPSYSLGVLDGKFIEGSG